MQNQIDSLNDALKLCTAISSLNPEKSESDLEKGRLDFNAKYAQVLEKYESSLKAHNKDQGFQERQTLEAKTVLYSLCIDEIVKISASGDLELKRVIESIEGIYKEVLVDFKNLLEDCRRQIEELSVEKDAAEMPYKEMQPDETIATERSKWKQLKPKLRKQLRQLFPPLEWIPKYNVRKMIRGDIIAGLTVGVMLIPQGMAYSLVAGLPPVYGLYSATIPLLMYGLLGTSHELSVGPVAMVSILVKSAVEQVAEEGTDEYINSAITMSLLVGIIQTILGLLKLGFVTNFMSHPVLSGFTTSAAMIISLTQLKHLFGTQPKSSNDFFVQLYEFFVSLKDTNGWTFFMGAIAIIVLLSLQQAKKKWKWIMYIPGPLLTVFFGILFTWSLDLNKSAGIKIVGSIPAGFPPVSIASMDRIGGLLPSAIIISIIGFIESVSVAKKLSDEKKYKIYPSQELVALGIANIMGSLFSSYPVTGGFSRTAVNSQSGANSTLSSLISSTIVIIAILILTPILKYLPMNILGAIIVVACYSLLDFGEAKHLWNLKKRDLIMWCFSFIATLLLGIEYGIISSVAISLLLVIYRSSRPHTAILGRLPGTKTYRNVSRYPNALVIPGITIFRVDSSLYFANSSFFSDKIIKLRRKTTAKSPLKCIIIDWSSINDIDSSACKSLEELFIQIKSDKIMVLMVSVKGPVRDIMDKSGLVKLIGKSNFFWEIHDAVQFAEQELQIGNHHHNDHHRNSSEFSPLIFDNPEETKEEKTKKKYFLFCS